MSTTKRSLSTLFVEAFGPNVVDRFDVIPVDVVVESVDVAVVVVGDVVVVTAVVDVKVVVDDVLVVVVVTAVLADFVVVLFEAGGCFSLLAMGRGSSLVSMMLVEAIDELKNFEVISLMRPLVECDAVTLVASSGVTVVVEVVVAGGAENKIFPSLNC